MIHFKNISLNIHGQHLLEEANLLIAEGEHIVVRGPSGCGKSSLLKLAGGGLPMSGGSILVNNVELSAQAVADIRSRIAFIGQEPTLGAEHVKDALLLPFTFKTHKDQTPPEALVFQTLEQLHLPIDILGKPSKRISGGEKQRIAIARALLLDKRIFLADEVTSALDPESKRAVMDALFRPEITMLSVSHDPDWISKCSRIIEIQDRKLIERGADPQIGHQKSAIKNSSNGGAA